MPIVPDISEALRYLRVSEAPGGPYHAQMTALAAELAERIVPRILWRTFPLDHADGLPTLRTPAPLALPGQTAKALLGDCHHAALLLCTLGTPFDLWLRQLQRRDMAQAVLLDALGSAWVEAACDAAEKEIAARFPECFLTDRFSPGYGDLPLDIQPLLLEAAGAPRIGLTLTPSMMMNPQKSVSALIGVADRPQAARIRGCAYCALNKTCTLKRKVGRCHVSP